MPVTLGTPLLWVGFVLLVLAVLALDLGVLRRGAREIGPREALAWSAGWVCLALAFAGFLYVRAGARPALEFLTGYVIEKALSIDNVFVILVVLTSFAVPTALWHRVLALGVLGALVMRGALILGGASLVAHVHATTYVFGAILIITAIRLIRSPAEEAPAPASRHPVARFVGRFFAVTDGYRGGAFSVREGGRRMITPLLVALVVVEISDVVFAVDSIPAIFAVTTDPFVVFTSNVFAILGLRSLFFAVRGLVDRLHYLKAALAFVLLFVGVKMLIAGVYVIPIGASLGVIALAVVLAVVASSARERRLVREGRLA